MASIEDLRQWIGKDVLDGTGEKTGKLADVYFDVQTDEPLFLVIDQGRRSANILVPAWNATSAPDHVTVTYQPDALSGAPTVDLTAGLTVEEEQQLFTYWSVQYQPSSTPSGRRLMRR